jgi:hypothetical protein
MAGEEGAVTLAAVRMLRQANRRDPVNAPAMWTD